MKKILNGEEVEVSLAEQKGLEAEWAVADAAIASVAATQYQRDRATAYETEADALFFQEQRGEVTVGTWHAKIDEIKARFPK